MVRNCQNFDLSIAMDFPSYITLLPIHSTHLVCFKCVLNGGWVTFCARYNHVFNLQPIYYSITFPNLMQ
jgi:hypothetical protein